MITEKELINIGNILKPHGIKGEVTASLDYDIDIEELKCIVMPIDNIFVPFFVNNVRPKSTDNVLLSIDGINDENEAKSVCGLTYYALISDVAINDGVSDDGGYVADFIGYKIYNNNESAESLIGTITDFDDTTDNVLFHVENSDGKTIFIPVAAELINSINPDSETIIMSLPEGLLDL